VVQRPAGARAGPSAGKRPAGMRAQECRERGGEGVSPCERPSSTPLPCGRTPQRHQLFTPPETCDGSLSHLTTPHKLQAEASARS
jgi:hypothetical protein